MEWAAYSKQPLMFLKLDFSEVYGIVDWAFLFQAMEKLGFLLKFVAMVRLLFTDAFVSIKVNGFQCSSFAI